MHFDGFDDFKALGLRPALGPLPRSLQRAPWRRHASLSEPLRAAGLQRSSRHLERRFRLLFSAFSGLFRGEKVAFHRSYERRVRGDVAYEGQWWGVRLGCGARSFGWQVPEARGGPKLGEARVSSPKTSRFNPFRAVFGRISGPRARKRHGEAACRSLKMLWEQQRLGASERRACCLAGRAKMWAFWRPICPGTVYYNNIGV